MRTSLRVSAVLVAAGLVFGSAALPAFAAPPSDEPGDHISPPIDPSIYEIIRADRTVPKLDVPTVCKALLSPEATSLFGARLTSVTPTDDGTRSALISGIIDANDGTVCAWRVGTTKNVIQFSVTPISEYQRRQIIADWNARFGIPGVGVGGDNLIFTTGSPIRTESAALLEDGLYLTATPVDGTWFPAFIQLQADHMFGLVI